MNKKVSFHFSLWNIALLTFFGGCQVGPSYNPPAMSVPSEWSSPLSEGMSEETCSNDTNDRFVWWESLNDPQLSELIETASGQNLDLHIAAARILEARRARLGKSAEQLPSVNASANYGYVSFNREAIFNDLLDSSCCSKKKGRKDFNFFEFGFDAEWELDLFGLKDHELKVMQAKIEAAEESYNDIWVSLSAEIARNYIELRGFQKRLNILEKEIEFQMETISLTQELVKVGLATLLDIQQAKVELSILFSQRPPLELEIQKNIHHLSILLGYPPGDLFCELGEAKALPCLPCEKPISVPSEILRRRPDVRKAERELAAATENIGVAVANLFPRFSLRGFVGDINTHAGSWFGSKSGTFYAGPQILAPIFNSNLIKEDIKINQIRAKEAFFEYKKAVLKALEESENAIASLYQENEKLLSLKQAFISSEKTLRDSLELYQKGFKDYLNVLLAYRTLLTLEDSLVQSEVNALIEYITLYKALGGAWDSEEQSCYDLFSS